MKAGLIGFPLKNGFSKAWFTQKFKDLNWQNSSYENFPIEQIGSFLDLCKEHPELNGLSVTIPHKQAIIPFLDKLDPLAASIGAVNCIHFFNGELIGYNTDAIGFKESILNWFEGYKPKAALVLGIGGAAKAIIHVLKSLDIETTLVGRTTNSNQSKKAYSELSDNDYQNHELIVNCSPLGMHPNPEGIPPLDYMQIGSKHWCYDLIYNPEQTRFLFECQTNGAKTKNGLEMLHLQAEAAFQIWSSK